MPNLSALGRPNLRAGVAKFESVGETKFEGCANSKFEGSGQGRPLMRLKHKKKKDAH